MAGEELIELKFRLADGTDIGPNKYNPTASVGSLKEKILAQWPKGCKIVFTHSIPLLHGSCLFQIIVIVVSFYACFPWFSLIDVAQRLDLCICLIMLFLF